MNCNTVRGLLPLYVGEDLTEARQEEVRRHLEGCGACAEELDQFTRCRELLQELRDVELPRSESKKLWDSVRGRLLLRPRPGFRAVDLIRAAAVLVIGLSLGFTVTMLVSGREVKPLPEPAPTAEASKEPVPVPPIVLDNQDVDRPVKGRVERALGGEHGNHGPEPGWEVRGDKIIIRRLPVYQNAGTAALQAEIRRLRLQLNRQELRIRQLERALREKRAD